MSEDAGEPKSPDERDEAGPDHVGKTLADPLAEKDRKIDELTQALKRVQAEFDNYRKRIGREWTERAQLASESMMLEILPVLDTLDKALQSPEAGRTADDPERAGIEGIRRQLLQAMQRRGLREIRTDVKFDPFEHEALQRIESDDAEDGRILEVFQKGYLLGPKVIRTAKVKVWRKPPKEEPPQDDDNHDEEYHEAQESEEQR